MRAVYYERFGGADVLTVGDLPDPEPGPGEVLIALQATSVNPIDWKIREGLFECVFDHRFPIVPGWDAAGTVAAVGAGVDGLAVGQAVYAYCRKPVAHEGTYAEYVTMPADAVAPAPASLTAEQAAAIPLCALTCWQSLVDFGQVQAGDSVLIHAGAGGVGSLGIQLAKHLGARVLTTASARNADYVTGLGADLVIDYTRQDYRATVRAAAPDGVDMILDGVGGAIPAESLELIRGGGGLACLNEPPDEAAAASRGIRTARIYAEPNGAQLGEIAKLIDAGALRPPAIDTLPLARAAEAMARSQTGHVRGKLVLHIG